MRIGVIGAGAIGLATAWRLLQRGASVDVYERGELGHGATWASAGLLVASAAHAPNGIESPMVELCRRGLAEWGAFVAELEAACGVSIGYRDEGTLLVALNDVEAQRMRAHATTAWLSAAEIGALESSLDGRTLGGELHRDEHSVDNRRLVVALGTVVRHLGGRIHEHTSASIIGDATPVVRSRLGDRTYDEIIVAGGAWSGSIEGVPNDRRLPTRPVKGQMIALRDPTSGPWLRHTVMTDDVYLVPRADRLLVGATTADAGFDVSVRAEGTAQLLAGARRALGDIDASWIVDAWAGVRPGSPDDAPLLGRWSAGVVAACGHYRNGILLTPLTGTLVADIALGTSMPAWAEPFAATRFR